MILFQFRTETLLREAETMRRGIELHSERFRSEIDTVLTKMNRIGYQSPGKALMNGTSSPSADGKMDDPDHVAGDAGAPLDSHLRAASALDAEINVSELPPPLLPTSALPQ